MRAYSSVQMARDWRYAIAQDLTTSDGTPYPYAQDGHRKWGDEIHQLAFDSGPRVACVTEDGSLLAIAAGKEIHIIETSSWTTSQVLIGHDSTVEKVAFRPNDSNTLASTSRNYSSGVCESSTILIWKLDQVRPLDTSTIVQAVSETVSSAVAAASDSLESHQVTLSKDEAELLGKKFEPALTEAVTRYAARDTINISGRSAGNLFSPSGKWMVYVPGKDPRSHAKVPWDMVICSAEDLVPHLTLKGHTDAIMWTGWSADESMFASVCWDGTARVWDPFSGEVIMKVETGVQNWTGGFSPDSKFFAFVDGRNRVRIHKPRGKPSEHWVYGFEKKDHYGWRQTLTWHPNSQWLAIGGDKWAELFLLDVENKSVLQRRILSTAACQVDDEADRDMMPGFLVTLYIYFLDNGKKFVTWNSPDSSIEVFDLEKEVKWRFARGGTEDGDGAEKWRDENGKVTSNMGSGMIAWEDRKKGVMFAVSLDFDVARIWSIPLTEGSV